MRTLRLKGKADRTSHETVRYRATMEVAVDDLEWEDAFWENADEYDSETYDSDIEEREITSIEVVARVCDSCERPYKEAIQDVNDYEEKDICEACRCGKQGPDEPMCYALKGECQIHDEGVGPDDDL